MSEEKNENNEAEVKSSGSIVKMAIWLLVATISIGGGFATPFLIAQMNSPATEVEEPEPEEIDPNEELAYIDFEEVVVNLTEQQFSRYLKMNFSLAVPESKKMDIEKLIESKKAVLLDRINAHFAEVHTDDLKGKFGLNRIRRQMHGYFNEILFDDGIEQIQDILFRAMHVQ